MPRASRPHRISAGHRTPPPHYISLNIDRCWHCFRFSLLFHLFAPPAAVSGPHRYFHIMTPYDNRGYLHPFWNGNIYLYGVGELPRTVGVVHLAFPPYSRKLTVLFLCCDQLTELAMCQLSASIRAVPGWQNQLQDPKSRRAWRRSARRVYRIRTSSEVVDVDLSSRQVRSHNVLPDDMFRSLSRLIMSWASSLATRSCTTPRGSGKYTEVAGLYDIP